MLVSGMQGAKLKKWRLIVRNLPFMVSRQPYALNRVSMCFFQVLSSLICVHSSRNKPCVSYSHLQDSCGRSPSPENRTTRTLLLLVSIYIQFVVCSNYPVLTCCKLPQIERICICWFHMQGRRREGKLLPLKADVCPFVCSLFLTSLR